ncbi:Queuine tRNA-ribosyltransferase [Pirellula sp. SH-Sr6A]|uniref:tRNA guanosine(34) transglycosylase Tgt n=1 Tax=Pirellula sp. SH-Sr6A TaxID=1632865 RepID=UPI00078D0DE8|nr:tRNA guanosine(34) transglycosylase Tgt [Pirellula sp. SH-Sr6A]AMV30804.1 Queuine tRNA-ribosyltransferase [Pirellula sp. SH-Sr6A]
MVQSSRFPFELLGVDASTHARRGRLHLTHGVVQTPAFMPVGTQGTVKGLTIDQVESTGAEILLGNTYHLALRPTSELVAELDGLHRFIGWDKPILTDSGGFQIFSLGDLNQVTEDGATFKSHLNGSKIHLRPEDSIRIQQELGSDVAMVLDHVIALPAEKSAVLDAMHRSIRWAERCKRYASREDQALFAIVQGGLDIELRQQCAEGLVSIGFDGYAVGGLSVGEPPEEMLRVLDGICPVLPTDQPRYLMGVGTPIDLVEGVARGIDMFDCVMPTRNGRNALAFTADGPLRMRNSCHTRDARPIEEDCPCLACRHSRAYIRHLFMCDEMLGPTLLSIHNLTFYQRLMAAARSAIEENRYGVFLDEQRVRLAPKKSQD